MPSPNPAPARETRLIQLIVFRLASEEFAIPIGEVREIIRGGPITPVPGSGRAVKGMINVRGEIAVVVDLRARFGLRERDASQPKHIVITSQGKNLFALIVDEVAEILRIGADEVRPAPDLGTRIDRGLVTGFVVRGPRIIVLVDLAATLAEDALTGPPA